MFFSFLDSRSSPRLKTAVFSSSHTVYLSLNSCVKYLSKSFTAWMVLAGIAVRSVRMKRLKIRTSYPSTWISLELKCRISI